MMNSPKPDYSREFEDISGVTDVSAIMKKRRDDFETAFMNMEDDRIIGYLLAVGNKKDARPDHGLLQSTLFDLRDFQDRYLYKTEPFFDTEAQQRDLTIVFNKAMGVIIKQWPALAKAGYDWNMVCRALSTRIINVAKVFGVDNPVRKSIDAWFENYKEFQRTEEKYQQRDKLNADALRAHSELSYLSMVGAEQDVMNKVRLRIANIDHQLRYLPVDPNNPPAFTSFSNQRHMPESMMVAPQNDTNPHPKVVINKRVNPETEEITQITRLPQIPAAQNPQPEAPKKKSWLKKVPLIGRWF